MKLRDSDPDLREAARREYEEAAVSLGKLRDENVKLVEENERLKVDKEAQRVRLVTVNNELLERARAAERRTNVEFNHARGFQSEHGMGINCGAHTNEPSGETSPDLQRDLHKYETVLRWIVEIIATWAPERWNAEAPPTEAERETGQSTQQAQPCAPVYPPPSLADVATVAAVEKEVAESEYNNLRRELRDRTAELRSQRREYDGAATELGRLKDENNKLVEGGRELLTKNEELRRELDNMTSRDIRCACCGSTTSRSGGLVCQPCNLNCRFNHVEAAQYPVTTVKQRLRHALDIADAVAKELEVIHHSHRGSAGGCLRKNCDTCRLLNSYDKARAESRG